MISVENRKPAFTGKQREITAKILPPVTGNSRYNIGNLSGVSRGFPPGYRKLERPVENTGNKPASGTHK